jgi:hypothetical protein
MTGLRQIWTDSDYVYAATSSGLGIIDIDTEQTQSFATNPNGYNTVWADDDYVFVGTVDNGVEVLSKSDIGPAEISSFMTTYAQVPDLGSNDVVYIHGNSTKLICCTTAGVNIIRRDSHYITGATISGAKKCFVTPDYSYYYYTVEDTDNSTWYLYRLDGNTGNWSSSDVTYSTGAGFLRDATTISDMYVTEHTSLAGTNNTLFLATLSGVYVYDEGTNDYFVFTTVS